MAKFKQALIWLREGNKVTRPCWKQGSYWKLGVDEIIFWGDEIKATVHLNQLEAEDWILFKKDLSMTDKQVRSMIKTLEIYGCEEVSTDAIINHLERN